MKDVKIEVYHGMSKKTGKPFRALNISIGIVRLPMVFPSPTDWYYLENSGLLGDIPSADDEANSLEEIEGVLENL